MRNPHDPPFSFIWRKMPLKSNNDLLQEFLAAATGNATDMGVDAALPGLSSVPGVTESTVRAAGVQTAPGAGVEIAATAPLGSAFYKVTIQTFIGGTTVAALEAINMRLKVNDGATSAADILLNPVPGTAGSSELATHEFFLSIPNNGEIAVVANSAATAASLYYAKIFATKMVYL